MIVLEYRKQLMENKFMKKYTKANLIEEIGKASGNMCKFYRCSFINYTGTTYQSDGAELYTEIIAEWLLNHMEYLTNQHIRMITREGSYCIDSHDGETTNFDSNREEERIAMDIRKNESIPFLGNIIDYQTPLSNCAKDNAGKIDLLSFNDTDRILRILELKKAKSKESLLRCVLEGYTYYLTVDTKKLLNNFNITNCKCIKVCPLFFKDSNPYREYDELCQGKRPYLYKLMKRLGIEPILLMETGADEKNAKHM